MTDPLKIGSRYFWPITADHSRRKPGVRVRIQAKYGTLAAAARAWGVKPQKIYNLLYSHETLPQWMLDRLDDGQSDL